MKNPRCVLYLLFHRKITLKYSVRIYSGGKFFNIHGTEMLQTSKNSSVYVFTKELDIDGYHVLDDGYLELKIQVKRSFFQKLKNWILGYPPSKVILCVGQMCNSFWNSNTFVIRNYSIHLNKIRNVLNTNNNF